MTVSEALGLTSIPFLIVTIIAAVGVLVTAVEEIVDAQDKPVWPRILSVGSVFAVITFILYIFSVWTQVGVPA